MFTLARSQQQPFVGCPTGTRRRAWWTRLTTAVCGMWNRNWFLETYMPPETMTASECRVEVQYSKNTKHSELRVRCPIHNKAVHII